MEVVIAKQKDKCGGTLRTTNKILYTRLTSPLDKHILNKDDEGVLLEQWHDVGPTK